MSAEELRHYESIKDAVSREKEEGARVIRGTPSGAFKSGETSSEAFKSAETASNMSSPGANRCSEGLLSTALLPPLRLYQDVRKEKN